MRIKVVLKKHEKIGFDDEEFFNLITFYESHLKWNNKIREFNPHVYQTSSNSLVLNIQDSYNLKSETYKNVVIKYT